METTQAVALVTDGGIYLIEDRRWLKATAFRRGNVPTGVGGWETITRLLRAPADAQEWSPTTPEGIQPGDIVGIVSRSHRATTSEVATVIHGHDLRITNAAQIPTDHPHLIMTATQAFLIGGERDIELLERGFTSQIEQLTLEPSDRAWVLTVQTSETLARG